MATTLNSLDNILTQSAVNGNQPIWWVGNTLAATTAATTTSGYVTVQRYPNPIVMPASFGTGVTGAYLTYCRMASVTGATTCLVGIEYLLGTLTVSGNSYVNGVSMPFKTLQGVRVQTAAPYVFAVMSTALIGTTPVLTINYTNQAGTTGRSTTFTVPTSTTINSAFCLNAILQSGDTGIISLSASAPNGLSISAGTGGVIKLYGVLPLSLSSTPVAYETMTPDPLTVSENPYLIEASESIGFYRMGIGTASLLYGALNLVPSD